jgi:hypothetical protein
VDLLARIAHKSIISNCRGIGVSSLGFEDFARVFYEHRV